MLLLTAVPMVLSLTPAKGGDAVICLTKMPVLALTTSTVAFEPSAR